MQFGNHKLIMMLVLLLAGCTTSELQTPEAMKGVLDLRSYSFENSGTVNLSGEWEFYWNRLYTPENFLPDSARTDRPSLMKVPGVWNGLFPNAKTLPARGTATYRLRILMPEKDNITGFQIPDFASSYSLWVNGTRVASNGKVSLNLKEVRSEFHPLISMYHGKTDTLELVVQIANSKYSKGGMWQSIRIGPPSDILSEYRSTVILDYFLIGALLILAFYNLWIYFLRKSEKEAFWSGLLSLSAILRILTTNERQILQILPDIPPSLVIRLEYFTVYSVAPIALSHFIYYLFMEETSRRFIRITTWIGSINTFIILLFPLFWFTFLNPLFQVTVVIVMVCYACVAYMAFLHKKPLSLVSFIGFILLLLFGLNDVLNAYSVISTFYLVPFGVLLFLITQAYITTHRIADSFEIIQKTSEELNRSNSLLEKNNKELQDSQRRFETIVNKTSDLICVSNLDGTLTFISPSVRKMLGYLPSEMIGAKGYSLIHPDDIPYAKQALKSALVNLGWNRIHQIDYRLRHKDGHYIYAEVRPTFITAENKIKAVILIIQDITERKLAEQKQKEYEKLLEQKVDERTHELQIQSEELNLQKEKADKLLLNILPEETANELKQFGHATPRTYGMVSVMFTDFIDFTSISERVVPELLVAEIDYCFSAFDSIVQKHGVEKIKTVGDAYIAASGIPAPVQSHATEIVKAAQEIIRFMETRKAEKLARGEIPFELRVGIHSGPVVAGIVGTKKFAYDIWGDTVNTAARMEQNSSSGRINISGTTYDLIKKEVACEYRGRIPAKNKGEIDMYFVNPEHE